MKVGTLLFILHDVIDDLFTLKLLLPNGDFVGPTLAQDVEIVKAVENRLKQHGVTIQSDVDKVINVLPLVISLVR